MSYTRITRRIAQARSEWENLRDINAIRESFEALFAAAPTLPSETFVLAGIPCLRIGNMPGTPILYCHGGGFQIGSTRSHRAIMEQIATRSARPVIGFDYPLAPEHRYPAALNAAIGVYSALTDTHDAPISLAGDSAGGGLALALFQAARDAGLALPDRIALISAWLDLTLSGGSYTSRAEVDIFSTPQALRAMARSYAGKGTDPAEPSLSPINMRNLQDLPPILIHAGDSDITLSDSQTFAARAQTAGADVALRVWPGMFHHFQMFPDLPESQESLDEIGAFLRR